VWAHTGAAAECDAALAALPCALDRLQTELGQLAATHADVDAQVHAAEAAIDIVRCVAFPRVFLGRERRRFSRGVWGGRCLLKRRSLRTRTSIRCVGRRTASSASRVSGDRLRARRALAQARGDSGKKQRRLRRAAGQRRSGRGGDEPAAARVRPTHCSLHAATFIDVDRSG
jgi:hypothetical protein